MLLLSVFVAFAFGAPTTSPTASPLTGGPLTRSPTYSPTHSQWSKDYNAGCKNATCFPDCMAAAETSYQKFPYTGDKSGYDFLSTERCVEQCYLDSCSVDLDGLNVMGPKCNGTDAVVEGNTERGNYVHYEETDCLYTCGSSCKMAPGFGPSGRFENQIFSRVPDGALGAASEYNGGHTWTIALDFNNLDYTVDVSFKLSDRYNVGQAGSNFAFECKNEPYIIADTDKIEAFSVAVQSSGLSILFMNDGQIMSDCLRGNLTEHHMEFVGRPAWIGDGYSNAGVAFRFLRRVPSNSNPDDLTFWENPDVVYTVLTQPTTMAPTLAPTSDMPRSMSPDCPPTHDGVRTIYAIVLGVLLGLSLLVHIACFCHKRSENGCMPELKQSLVMASKTKNGDRV